MNRIVREHYPVDKLPEDLRQSLTGEHPVRVVLEQDDLAPEAAARSLEAASGHFSRWQHLRRSHFETQEEIVAHVRALRDEWDRR